MLLDEGPADEFIIARAMLIALAILLAEAKANPFPLAVALAESVFVPAKAPAPAKMLAPCSPKKVLGSECDCELDRGLDSLDSGFLGGNVLKL